jgi:diguanylate cyclase (GGDEF)-like protein
MADQTILVIDDSDYTQAVLGNAFEGMANLTIAATGKTGLEKALAVAPSLIFLDLSLPDIDGFRVCEALKKDARTKDIPLIVLDELKTAGDKKDARAGVKKALALGANDYMTKPVEVELAQARAHTLLDLYASKKELSHMALVDPLTGCFNRRYFMNSADMELSRRKRHMYDLVVAVLEIDFFDSVTETYGHDTADEVLYEVAKIIEDTVRYEDTVGRYRGGEFAVLLPEANVEGAQTVLERVREKVAAKLFTEGEKSFNVTVSIGLTEVDARDVSTADIMARADKALRRAKTHGHDQLVVEY